MTPSATAAPARISARARPSCARATGRPGRRCRAGPARIEHFLTERYCLYAADRRGRLLRQEIDHAPWPLQPAEADIELCTMTRPLGIDVGSAPPLAHFARRLDVVSWLPHRVR